MASQRAAGNPGHNAMGDHQQSLPLAERSSAVFERLARTECQP